MIGADFAIMHKTRPAHDTVAVTEIAGRVRDKVAIVGDDVITTGGTLIAGAQALKEHGAREVWVFVDARALLAARRSRSSPRPASPASSSPTRCRSTRSRSPTT